MNKHYRLLGMLGVVFGMAGCVAPQNYKAQEPKVSEVVERPVADQPITSKARTSAKLHTELGVAYLQAARVGVALDEANQALSYDQTYAPAHLLKAQVYVELEQYSLARPEFEEAVRLAPGDPTVNNTYGWFLCSQGQEGQGLQRLEMAARNPYYATPAKSWANAGLCYLRLKQDAQAEERFVRAYTLDEREPMPLYHLAQINLRAERYMRAKQFVDQLMNRQEPNADVLWLALRIERKLGNTESVRRFADKLRNDFPGSIEYQNYLQGKFE